MYELESLHRKAEHFKKMYPEGTRLILEKMDDPFSPVPPGTKGTVDFVDDIGQIHMHWDNGRSLSLVPTVDDFRKLTSKELEEEQAKNSSLVDRIQNAQKRAEGPHSAGNGKTHEPEH